ncbi:hypothetical protein FIA58_019105 [Flavobacterium jejuense]|uniref:Uncharacterized protein n=1 Tax=Flavobacterium jejuense TaxID=1544455 RepID=A0ABX0IZ01_9FLAO|nr:hypothetical protein [Flavobacterium jejuense]NHN27793.1 hypothetical protein [Flavobacterium jejuense]
MKEEQIKYILKKSEIVASNDLTDKIMLQIEVEKNKEINSSIVSFRFIIGICTLLFFIVGLILYYLNFSVFMKSELMNKSFKTIIFAFITFLLLISFNHLIKLKTTITNLS